MKKDHLQYRKEKDALGTILIPVDAPWGATTQRAITNFPISGQRSHRSLITAIITIKKAAARVHQKLGLLTDKNAAAIIQSCNEMINDSNHLSLDFPIDIYQAGAGTSLHMNVNEVIANRANKMLVETQHLASLRQTIHPNDHVNMAQSTNDVIPTALRIAALQQLSPLLDALHGLEVALGKKEKQFSHIKKTGRTHLADALPLTLGNEFGAYAQAIKNNHSTIGQSSVSLYSLGIGGTAVGTGANTHSNYRTMIINQLHQLTGLDLKPSPNLFASMQSTSDFLNLSASLRTLAQDLIRIGNDLRLLSSGPNTGLAEIHLPEVQPGSSIMPGKVNPSIIEMLTMVCFQVIGYDHAILLASQAGQLELNVMLPLIAYNLLEQITILTNAITIFTEKCVIGIEASEKMCQFWLERTNAIMTLLTPKIGYEKAAALVKEAQKKRMTARDLAKEKGYRL